jgi:prepilin-type N-terminal cleavage/methylation domain-containing protein
MNATKENESGFTLIEIAVAISILGIGFATLMATTIRLMDTTYQEIHRANASIYAGYILEVALNSERQSNRQGQLSQSMGAQAPVCDSTMPLLGSQSGALAQKLKQDGYFDGIEGEELNSISNWRYELQSQPIDIPLLPIPPEHIIITIYWGSQIHESYTLELIRPPSNQGTPSGGQGSQVPPPGS